MATEYTNKIPPRLALIACSVFEDEIALHAKGADHIVVRVDFDIGLHDRPNVMRAKLQEAIFALDDRNDIEAVILLYGLCGRGTSGLRAGRHKLVIARAHDCMALFLGSKERFAEKQAACPNCYFYTPGWNRARRVPGPERLVALREELAKRFDPEEVDFLVESERALWAAHGHAVYLALGTANAQSEEAYARKCAEGLGWSFEAIAGDATLLKDLLWGRWDEVRFQVVAPGATLQHSVDQAIFKTSEH
ncbi:MAG: DUF1638 domain-containing protein [Nibricoccus sp.]